MNRQTCECGLTSSIPMTNHVYTLRDGSKIRVEKVNLTKKLAYHLVHSQVSGLDEYESISFKKFAKLEPSHSGTR